MTRQDYLSELKEQLRSLPVEEQEEALEYYRGYFEDAGNDEEVMREFGTPEELAKSIVSKFAGVPSVRQKRTNDSNDGSCGSFTNDEVRSLDISLGGAEIMMIQGPNFSVDYRGLAPGDIRYGLSPFGTFSIENTRKMPDMSFWIHDDTSGNTVHHPRILIRVPACTKIDLLRLHIGAGAFTAKDVDIQTSRSYIDVGAGTIVLSKIRGGAAEFRCGMGNITYTGELHGLIKADCEMGNITLNLDGRPEDYSIGGKVGLGSVRFNEIHKDGFGTIVCSEFKENHFSINCGMGSVRICVR
jgi:Predicted membrane protein